jgi:cytochrome c oxidase subunit 4
MAAHVIPPRVYLTVFTILLVLTAITVWVAFHDFGPLNVVIALAIAGIKSTLVILFFMHVRYSTRVVKITAASGFIFLVILIAFTLADVFTRGKLVVGK